MLCSSLWFAWIIKIHTFRFTNLDRFKNNLKNSTKKSSWSIQGFVAKLTTTMSSLRSQVFFKYLSYCFFFNFVSRTHSLLHGVSGSYSPT